MKKSTKKPLKFKKISSWGAIGPLPSPLGTGLLLSGHSAMWIAPKVHKMIAEAPKVSDLYSKTSQIHLVTYYMPNIVRAM